MVIVKSALPLKVTTQHPINISLRELLYFYCRFGNNVKVICGVITSVTGQQRKEEKNTHTFGRQKQKQETDQW